MAAENVVSIRRLSPAEFVLFSLSFVRRPPTWRASESVALTVAGDNLPSRSPCSGREGSQRSDGETTPSGPVREVLLVAPVGSVIN